MVCRDHNHRLIEHDIEQPGQDLYYSEALKLPANWIFHDQNVTFQQFAQSDVFGSPWILMFVQNDHLFVAQHPCPDRLRRAAAGDGLDARVVALPRRDGPLVTTRSFQSCAAVPVRSSLPAT